MIIIQAILILFITCIVYYGIYWCFVKDEPSGEPYEEYMDIRLKELNIPTKKLMFRNIDLDKPFSEIKPLIDDMFVGVTCEIISQNDNTPEMHIWKDVNSNQVVAIYIDNELDKVIKLSFSLTGFPMNFVYKGAQSKAAEGLRESLKHLYGTPNIEYCSTATWRFVNGCVIFDCSYTQFVSIKYIHTENEKIFNDKCIDKKNEESYNKYKHLI